MPNKAETQIALDQRLTNSPFAQLAEMLGKNESPEAVRLRNSVWGPLTSGQYVDTQRQSMPMETYKEGVRGYLGTGSGNPTPQAQAQSLGLPPELLQYLLAHYSKTYGDYKP